MGAFPKRSGAATKYFEFWDGSDGIVQLNAVLYDLEQYISVVTFTGSRARCDDNKITRFIYLI